MENRNTIMIAGGGTGGHIYPAIAIARSLQKLEPSLSIEFVGSKSGLETTLVPRENFPLHLISVGKLHRSVGIVQQLKTLVGLPFAFFQALFLILRFRPKAVLGVGGYASGPVVFVASLLGIPTYIWEPNAFPGLTNRWLAKLVRKCLVVFKDAEKFFGAGKTVTVGLPVRGEIQAGPRDPLRGRPFRVLVFGGSQGARTLNESVSEAVLKSGEWLKDVEIVHQTGKLDFQKVQSRYAQMTAPVKAHEFLYDMGERLKWADLVVCRAGASTVAEVAAAGKAAVFVPFPFASDNHQQKNAEALVEKGAAHMILNRDFTAQAFQNVVSELKSHPERIQELENNIRPFYRARAGEEIAQIILSDSQS